MGKGTPEAIAEKAVLQWLGVVTTQQNRDALIRLVEHQDAICAWHKLSGKIPHGSSTPDLPEMALRLYAEIGISPEQENFYAAASWIGRAAVSAFRPENDKLTTREIRESATEAAKLADQLCRLIDFNSYLEPTFRSIEPTLQGAALDRVTSGLLQTKIKSGAFFSEEVERELDDQARKRHEEESDRQGIIHQRPEVTTSDAWKILSGYCISPADDLKERLRKFAKRARWVAEIKPTIQRPKSSSADQHEFALSICHTLTDYCGTPNYEIAAAFTSAVFNIVVSSDTIKKWFKRDRDSSMQ